MFETIPNLFLHFRAEFKDCSFYSDADLFLYIISCCCYVIKQDVYMFLIVFNLLLFGTVFIGSSGLFEKIFDKIRSDHLSVSMLICLSGCLFRPSCLFHLSDFLSMSMSVNSFSLNSFNTFAADDELSCHETQNG